MKKCLISFLLLVSSMFFVYNVKAFTFDYDNFNISDTDINNLVIVRDYLNEHTSKHYNIIRTSEGFSNGDGYKVIFFKNSPNNGNWYILSDKNSSSYYFTQYGFGFLDNNNKLSQNNYSNFIQDSAVSGSQAPVLPYNATQQQLDSYLLNLDSVINSNYYRHNVVYANHLSSTDKIINGSNNLFYLLYSNFDLPVVSRNLSGFSFNFSSIIYNSTTYQLDNGDIFVPYLNAIEGGLNKVVINSVKEFGNNSFGFYQNVVGLNVTSLSGAVDTLSIVCEEDKPFLNGYCSMNYDDLLNHNSDLNTFNNYSAQFTQLFGSNSGYLYNDKYYLYSFRIQKPFVPEVGNLFINSLTNNSFRANILNVYLNDSGSYTDYVVKFKIENSNFDSNSMLNDIMVVFRDGLGSYYSNSIPTTFNFSVYRSFKLQIFDVEPTINDINNFYNDNDLSHIDGLSSQSSFFTDNEFNSFGFGGIITAPFRFLYALLNYESCSDIVLPFPHSNQNLTLTCVRKNIPSSINPLIVILQVILSGIVSYRIAVGTLNIIKDVSSPDDANIEVVDL